MASSSTTGTSPSVSSSSSTASSMATENRLYQASLILEWQLYNDLLSRHRQAVSRLQDLTNEAAALRQENTLLRSSNDDLKRRIVSRLLAATRDTNRDRTSLPTSISVRSTGYMNIDHANHQINSNSLNSALNPSIIDNKFVTMSQTRLNIEKEEAEMGLTSISVRSNNNSLNSALNPSKFVTMNQKRLNIQKEEEAEMGLTSIEVDAFYQGTYKTELCKKWQEIGACPYKDHCQFAHGISELRPVLRHPRYKTQVCRMLLSGVPCPYGHRCHFRHALPLP